ncbi:unnamed protein product, partial [Dicrocoelium dendriticum]
MSSAASLEYDTLVTSSSRQDWTIATREDVSRDEQAGFHPDRGWMDNTFTLRKLLELRHVHRRPLIVVFLDFQVVFDSVDSSALWNCLLGKGLPDNFVTIPKYLYSNKSGRII